MADPARRLSNIFFMIFILLANKMNSGYYKLHQRDPLNLRDTKKRNLLKHSLRHDLYNHFF